MLTYSVLVMHFNSLNVLSVKFYIDSFNGISRYQLTFTLLIYLNFHPLEVVFRYRDPQFQVVENHSYSRTCYEQPPL